MQQTFVAAGSTAALATTYPANGIALGKVPAADAQSRRVPPSCKLSHLRVDIADLTPTSVTCYLSHDAAGLHPWGETKSPSLFPYQDGSGKWASIFLEDAVFEHLASVGTAGTLYLQIVVDAGSGLSAVFRLFGKY